MELPERIQAIIGTTQEFEGGVFSSKKSIPKTRLKILKYRISSFRYFIGDLKHPAIEFLVKGNGFHRSRWTKPFPVEEYIVGKGGEVLINKSFSNN